MLPGLFFSDVKYKNIISLEKDKREGGPFNVIAVMHFDLFSFTAHVSHLR